MKLLTPLFLALALVGCNGQTDDTENVTAATVPNAPVAAVAAPNGGDWTQTVVATEEGGFRMGNPNAAVKLVEYGSLTCPHCAEFSEKATETLKDKVRSGKLSWEFRTYVREAVDTTATLLARCGGPQPFFPLVEQIYADQGTWFAGKLDAIQATAQQNASATPDKQFAAFAQVTGLKDYVTQRGLPAAKADACLADRAAAERLVKMVEAANGMNIPGTPTFFINGQMVPNAAAWEALQPALTKAGV